jgi:hypothetical protein
MAYFLFVDESGQDHRESPCEVLAGVTVEDRDLWNLVQSLQEAEVRHFGIRYSEGERELKARKLLKTKTYKQAAIMPPFSAEERRRLAKSALEAGETAGRQELAGLAQTKLAYASDLLDICARYRCKAFASIVDKDSPRPSPTHLRKDYAYLFERFFYFLQDKETAPSGIIVFDELEKSQSHILLEQMDRYFKSTAKGRQRSSQIIPEPFFVHSDLTTGIQLADLIAYIVFWGVRVGGMKQPMRLELAGLAEQVAGLRYKTTREVDGKSDYAIWSFAVINDLRAKEDKEE